MYINGFYIFKSVEEFPDKQGLHLFDIDGSLCKTTDQLFDHFELQLDFPAYFGGNWDGFEELLNDLSWANAKHYAIHIVNIEDLLSEEDPEELETFLDILLDAASQWSDVPNLEGEEEYRKRSGFYIYLLDTPENLAWCDKNRIEARSFK